MNPRTHLREHCDACCGTGRVGWLLNVTCPDCNGTGRRERHTHDARSAIDYEPALPAARPATWQRIFALAACARDATNSDVVRALLDELDAVRRTMEGA
jgi:hypothetical protein